MQIFKISTPFDLVAGRHFHRLGDRSFGFVHKTFHVTTTDIALHVGTTLGAIMFDSWRSLFQDQVGEFTEWHLLAVGCENGNLFQSVQIRSPFDRDADHDRKPHPSTKDFTNLLPPHGGHGLHHLIGVDPVPGQRLGLDLNPHRRKVRLVFGLDINSTRDPVQDLFDALAESGEGLELLQVRAILTRLRCAMGCVEQHCDIRFDTGNQFIHTHLDRLRKPKEGTGDIVVQDNPHFIKQFLARFVPGPFRIGL